MSLASAIAEENESPRGVSVERWELKKAALAKTLLICLPVDRRATTVLIYQLPANSKAPLRTESFRLRSAVFAALPFAPAIRVCKQQSENCCNCMFLSPNVAYSH